MPIECSFQGILGIAEWTTRAHDILLFSYRDSFPDKTVAQEAYFHKRPLCPRVLSLLFLVSQHPLYIPVTSVSHKRQL